MLNSGFAATVERKSIVDALKLLGKVVERKNTIPIVCTARLAITADGLEITGTDLDIAVTARLAADHAIAGTVCIDRKALADVVGKMKGGRVRIADTGDGRATVTDIDSGAVTRLLTRTAADFPNMTIPPVIARYDVDAEIFAHDLAAVGRAVSTEETRYYLNGIYWHGDINGRIMAATDGHRLIRSARECPLGAEDAPAVIVPRKTIGLALATLKSKLTDADSVTVKHIGEKAMIFEIGAVRIVSKMIDGVFPDYTRVIPSSTARTLKMDSAALSDAVESTTAHCGAGAKPVTLSLSAAWMTVSAHDAEAGRAGMVINDASYEGDDMGIGLNSTYFRELLGILPGTVTLTAHDETCPIKLTSSDAPHLIAVQMPFRTDAFVTPADLKRLEATPADTFAEEIAMAGSAKARGMVCARLRQWLNVSHEPRAGHLTVKMMLAAATGDMDVMQRAATELERMKEPAKPGRLPDPAPYIPVPETPAKPIVPEREPAPVTPETDFTPILVVLETGRRVFVRSDDLDDAECWNVRRVTETGDAFVKAGEPVLIARPDIMRRVQPRGPYKEAGNDDLRQMVADLAGRVEALERELAHARASQALDFMRHLPMVIGVENEHEFNDSNVVPLRR